MVVDSVDGVPRWVGFGLVGLGLMVNVLDLAGGVSGMMGVGLAVVGAIVVFVGAWRQGELSVE
ncbi:hypothetical protein [Halobaculum sp. MBLA0143]|uniref:hypothetical protein n=1 Tax=Halobaculum sp. MBLA0143 TaxID=3079933 RepID=UPI003523FC52